MKSPTSFLKQTGFTTGVWNGTGSSGPVRPWWRRVMILSVKYQSSSVLQDLLIMLSRSILGSGNASQIFFINLSYQLLLRESYPVLISCLEKVPNLYSDGTSDQKKKCETAKDILNSIYNTKCTLSYAVLCDVYTIYSNMAVLLQVNLSFEIEKVHCFPF